MIQATILLFVLGMTLTPMTGDRSVQPISCIVCGDRGASDVITNVILFIPVGAVFVSIGLRTWQAAVTGSALSLLIELAQFLVPGRHTALGDLLTNTIGACLGAWIWSHRAQLRHASPALRLRAVAALGVLAVAGPVLTGVLTQPRYPGQAWFGQWTPQLGSYVQYSGHVTGASAGDAPIASGPLANRDAVRAALEAREPLRVSLVAGYPPPSLAPVFAIANAAEEFVIFVAADGNDLVLHYPAIASLVRLTPLEVRVRGAMTAAHGSRFDVLVQRVGPRWCLAGPSRSECHGVTAGSGWRLLAPGYTSESGVMDALMMALLFGLMMFLARERRAWIIVGLAALPTLLAGWVPGLVFAGAPIAGAAAGALTGRALAVVSAPRSLRRGTRRA